MVLTSVGKREELPPFPVSIGLGPSRSDLELWVKFNFEKNRSRELPFPTLVLT